MSSHGLLPTVLLSSITLLLSLSPSIHAAEDKYYSENEGEGKVSNKGYWGKNRGHVGGEEQRKPSPIVEEPEQPEFTPFEFPVPLYSNLSFGITLNSNYDDYERHGTSLASNPGIDYVVDDIFADDLVWQANIDYKNGDVLVSNGIGILPEDSLIGVGVNAFWDIELNSGNHRLSVGTKYDDPNYIFNLSSNIYFPTSGKDHEGDLVNSVDIRAEGAITTTVKFHSSFEYFFGDDIQMNDDYDPTDNSHKLTVGLDYTPISLLQLGAEATKVKEHDVGYGVYLYFNYDPWRPLSEQLELISDNDFLMHQMIPFSRSKVLPRTAN
ncbi:inverse autotransporter beta domain-containing protein [Moritella sp. 28]|uniref:inverse autotransporter beta domain-containing protein n=1 Tax=Moritella sp. 28 TaxID=2746232 RepID=UPI001BADD00D|nr:inverse autotransporter beta domain-containing protein [Moritella sp. 28]QUM86612.1 inverse autotransporter beta domain-containing protein [Moritella sp. 28]